jgi:hypothetical protein
MQLSAALCCWVDPEYTEALKQSHAHLWSMYKNRYTTKIEEKIRNTQFVQNLFEEKSKLDKNYTSLLADVIQWKDVSGIGEKHG